MEETFWPAGHTLKTAVGERLQLSPTDSMGCPAWCGMVLPALALPFCRPVLLLLRSSASLPTLLSVAHWVGNGSLMFLFLAGMLHFEVGTCDFHLLSVVGCREKVEPKLQCLRHFNLLGTKLEELNPGKNVG